MKSFVRLAASALFVLLVGLTASSQSSKSVSPAPGAAPGQNPTAKQQTQPPKTQEKTQQKKPPAVGRLRREVRLVNVVFSVLNKKNRFVTDLEQKNFEIFDDDLPQQVEFFSRETNLPLRIGLLLDTSNSIRSRLEFEQNAAFDFLYRTIRPGQDQAFLMTFDTHPQIQQGFTGSLDLLRQAIYSQRSGGGTALYDAIYDSSRDQLLNPPPPTKGNNLRRVLVLISDGMDDLSNHTRSEAIEMAERAGVVIYTISTSTQWVSPDQRNAEGLPTKIHHTPGDKVLQQFADDSGGRAFFPSRVEDLSQAFADIGVELRSQYSLAYTPSNHSDDGKFHRIHLELVGRKGLKIRARQGYWAEPSAASPAASPGH
jgi:Ca-activated chloride channel family protein